MNIEDELEETKIEDFASQVQTLFCHDVVYNQLVQIGYFLFWIFPSFFFPFWKVMQVGSEVSRAITLF